MAGTLVASLAPVCASTYVLDATSSPVSVVFDDNGGAAGGGRMTLTMKSTGTVWSQGTSGGGDNLTVSSVTPAADGLSLTAVATTSAGYPITLSVVLNATSGDLAVTIGGNAAQSITNNINYPYSFFPLSGPGYAITNPGTGQPSNGLGYAVLPFFGGYLVPTSNTTATWSTPSAHSRQEWFGGTDGGWNEGWMCIGEPGADMLLTTKNTTVGGVSRIGGAFQWIGSNANASLTAGLLSYDRKSTYRFFSSGGYVAQAKRFREYATAQGWVVPLSTKAQTNSDVLKLIGAPVLYLWGDGRDQAMLDSLHARGLNKALIQISINHVDENNKFPNAAWADGTGWSNYIATNYGSGWATGIYDIYGAYRDGSVPPYNGFYYDWAAGGATLPANDTNPATSWGYITSSGGISQTAVGTQAATTNIANSKAALFASEPNASFKGRIAHHVSKFGFNAFFFDIVCANQPIEDFGTKYGNTHSASREQDIAARGLLLASASVPPAGSSYTPRLAGTEQAKSWAVPVLDWCEGMFKEGASNAAGSYGSFDDNAYPSVTCDVVIPGDSDLPKLFTTGYQVPLWDLVYHDCLLSVQHWHVAHNKLLYVWDLADNFALIRGQAPMLHLCYNNAVVSGTGVGRTIASVQDSGGTTWNTKWTNPVVADRVMKTYNTVCNWQGTIGLLPMIGHQILAADSANNYSVQNSEFSSDGGASGYGIVVNFGTYDSATAKYAMSGASWSGTIRGNNLTVPLNEYRTYTWGGGAPDFSVAATPSSRTVTAGAGTTYSATVSTLNGFADAVAFDVSGLPSGATGSFSPASVSGAGSATLSIATSTATPAGTYTLTLTGTSGSLVHTATATLVVSPAVDFSIAATPSSRTVTAGGSTSYTATTTALNGFSSAVALSVSGLPAGASGTFSPASITGAGSSTLTVTASSSTPAGTYTLTLTGTSSGLVHTATTTLVVNVPDFSIAGSPASRTIAAGASTTYAATIGALNGFTGAVNLAVLGLPSGASGTFSPATVTNSGTSTLTVTTSASTPTGAYTITLRGASGSLVHTTPITLVIGAPDFTVAVSPSSQSLVVGNSRTYTVTVTAQNGFNGTVSLAASSSPAIPLGTFSFSPATIIGSGTSTLTVATNALTPPLTYTLTVTATSGSLNHTATAQLLAQGFNQSVAPSSQTVALGSSTNYTVTTNFVNSYSGTVTYSVLGLPSGALGTFSPATLSASGTSVLTVNTTTAATVGTYALTIRGTSGSIVRSTNATLVIDKAAATVALDSLNQTYDGSAKPVTVTTSPVGLNVAITYDGSAIPPTNAGSYAIVAIINDASYRGTASGTLLIAKASPVLSWAPPVDITYGTALTATQLAATASVSGSFSYAPAVGAVLNAGPAQALSAIFTPSDTANYVSGGVVTTTINVLQAMPALSWSAPADIVYGTSLSAMQLAATANVPGSFTYTPALGTVLNAGATQVLSATFTPSDATNYVSGGTVSTTITVMRAVPILSWTSPAAIVYGAPLSATQLAASANVSGVFAYAPALGTVLDAGVGQNLSATFIPSDTANYVAGGTIATTINVTPAAATVTLGNLVQAYDGTPKSVSVATDPTSLATAVTYDGSPTAPTSVGSYAVVATVNEANYTGSASGTLVIADTQAPVLSLPANFIVEATGSSGAVVTFTASAVDAVDGVVPAVLNHVSGSVFPLGVTTVTASATDAAGNIATGTFTVTVRDTTAPVISSLTASPNSIWPPNKKMVAVTLSAAASDAAGVTSLQILSVTTNEPDNKTQWQITGALTLNLLADRQGSGNGRIYTITVGATDAAGNQSTRTVTVTVPHDQGH